MSDIRALERKRIDRAAITLERAFSTDPMFRWIFPDDSRRSLSLRVLNRVPLEFGLRYGRVTQSHEGRAVAIWIPPGQEVGALGMIRCGMLKIPFKVGFDPFGKFMVANDTMGRIHKKVAEPHWYLLNVGVDPDLQGQGLGGSLVKDGLALADNDGVSGYLETSEERNLPYYQRLGFDVIGTAPLGKGGPPGWGMRRSPAAA